MSKLNLLAALTYSLLVLITTPGFADKAVEYPQVTGNPAYSAVTQLAHQPYDAKLAYGDDANQYGLLWHSRDFNRHGTLVVLIHGGCWLSAYDIQHTLPMATAISQAGFPVWSLEYRRTGDTGGGWPSTYEDIQAGIQYIPQLSSQNINPKRIIIAGHSAGGHLALLVARDVKKLLGDDIDTHFIGLAAITDIKTYARGENGCQKAGVQFMAGSPAEVPEDYAAANPVEHDIKASITLMHGEVDPIVPLAQTTGFNSLQLERIKIPGAGHFDWVHPGTPAFNRFLYSLRTIANQ
jgi:acetyl esterase/lipase